MFLWLHVLILLDFFKVCENKFRRELLMSPLTLVEEVAMASLLDDGSHDVLVPFQVVDRHELEVSDCVVFGIQDKCRNVNIGNYSIATGFPVELMPTFESADSPSDGSIKLEHACGVFPYPNVLVDLLVFLHFK